jgi:hypothetical protein
VKKWGYKTMSRNRRRYARMGQYETWRGGSIVSRYEISALFYLERVVPVLVMMTRWVRI